MDNKDHYVCSGCGGVGDKPGVCQTENCDCKGKPLKGCSCSDKNHKEVLSDDDKEESKE